MSRFIENLRSSLQELISELSENPTLFLRDPEKDFSRNRKIDFKTFIGITMNSGGCTMSKELLDYFNFNADTPSVSAYSQQRAKVLPEAFEYLFHEFTQSNNRHQKLYKGYRLIACDGTNLSIATNPDDPKTARLSNQHGTLSNHMHLNAFYDLTNRIYLDALVQTQSEYHEIQACIEMMERIRVKHPVVLIADRGYENYNLVAHVINRGWKFLIRIKDMNSNGIASSLMLPLTDTFDVDINLTLTRSQSKAAKKSGYKFMPTVQNFDYLPVGNKGEYPISFRIARFKLKDGSYEMVLTNLDRIRFSAKRLKELYRMRWGIETSFRELKYAVGLTSFHAKKPEYIMQEIFARLTLYNYCEMITAYVVKHSKKKTKKNQVNFTLAIYICREYLRQKQLIRPPDVVALIEKHMLPVRPGRKDPRKVKPQTSVSFIYRVA